MFYILSGKKTFAVRSLGDLCYSLYCPRDLQPSSFQGNRKENTPNLHQQFKLEINVIFYQRPFFTTKRRNLMATAVANAMTVYYLDVTFQLI